MRCEEEVQSVYDTFDMAELTELANARGDNFKFGMWVGKLAALGWVLGEPIANVKIHYDFDSWEIDQCTEADRMPPLEE